MPIEEKLTYRALCVCQALRSVPHRTATHGFFTQERFEETLVRLRSCRIVNITSLPTVPRNNTLSRRGMNSQGHSGEAAADAIYTYALRFLPRLFGGMIQRQTGRPVKPEAQGLQRGMVWDTHCLSALGRNINNLLLSDLGGLLPPSNRPCRLHGGPHSCETKSHHYVPRRRSTPALLQCFVLW